MPQTLQALPPSLDFKAGESSPGCIKQSCELVVLALDLEGRREAETTASPLLWLGRCWVFRQYGEAVAAVAAVASPALGQKEAVVWGRPRPQSLLKPCLPDGAEAAAL